MFKIKTVYTNRNTMQTSLKCLSQELLNEVLKICFLLLLFNQVTNESMLCGNKKRYRISADKLYCDVWNWDGKWQT